MNGDEEMITEAQADRLVKRVIELGHTEEEAYKTLAYVMKAEQEGEKKKEAHQPNKQ